MLSLGNPQQLADTYFADNNGWEDVAHTTEGVTYLKSKLVHTTNDKTEVYVTKGCVKATGTTAQKVFDSYWSQQLKWDTSTVAEMKILQDNGNSQIVYQTHKVLSAASAKKDLVFERSYSQDGTGYVIYSHSVESPLMPVQRQFGRANLLFHKCTIRDVSPGTVELVFLWCFDFNGWIHVKFIDAEKTKVALRATRIIKNTPGASLVASEPVTRVPSGRVDSNYAQYSQALRAQETPAPQQPTPQYRAAPVHAPFHATPVAQPAAAGPRFCSGCGAKAPEGRFCSSCGFQLR
eukprot:TRINITY_DN16690_c0_g1_i1.p1 TRINITY_DN16690_c0_g1~~TRINITY_DN16690_c0_g1_i1.p1  ORF type:complete len:292 (+),score=67.07 TRINITY_DN16690_c0_g1_i1:27-902(+)